MFTSTCQPKLIITFTCVTSQQACALAASLYNVTLSEVKTPIDPSPSDCNNLYYVVHIRHPWSVVAGMRCARVLSIPKNINRLPAVRSILVPLIWNNPKISFKLYVFDLIERRMCTLCSLNRILIDLTQHSRPVHDIRKCWATTRWARTCMERERETHRNTCLFDRLYIYMRRRTAD